MKENSKKNLPKAPWWLKAWGVIAFYGLMIGATETPDGGLAFWWTASWLANFGIFGAVSNRYDWGDDKRSQDAAKKTEGAE